MTHLNDLDNLQKNVKQLEWELIQQNGFRKMFRNRLHGRLKKETMNKKRRMALSHFSCKSKTRW